MNYLCDAPAPGDVQDVDAFLMFPDLHLTDFDFYFP